MKKKLLALAVAGAFVAPAAMADTANVTLYGQVNASAARLDNGTSTLGVSGTTTTHVSSDQSRIGFKGAEDLGGGTSAIWQIESGFNADAPATTTGVAGSAVGSTLGNRNTFVGLSGDSWGSVKLGNNDSAYKTAFRGYDVFFDTVADNRSLLGLVGAMSTNTNYLDARNANSITYDSPDMSGFRIGAQYAASGETATASANTKGSNWSLSGTYGAGPIKASVAWVELKAGTALTGTVVAGTAPFNQGGAAADDKIRAWRLGGSYAMDAFTVNAVYENVKGDLTTAVGAPRVDTVKANTWYLGGKFAISGSDAVKLSYARRGDIGDGVNKTANSTVKQYALGYDHAMSKRTTVYALYSRIDNDTASNQTFAGISTAALGTAGTGGADPSAWQFGIKHSF